MVVADIQLLNKDEDVSRFNHGSILAELAYWFQIYIKARRLGRLVVDPDVQLLTVNKRVRPDLAFIFRERLEHILVDNIIYGAPDLVVEVISPASFVEDTEAKKILYAAEGIPEYWIILPEMRMVGVFELQAGNYQPISHALEQGQITSKIFPDLELTAEALFNPA
jgi:Uma2 family endonuclease